MVATAAAGAVGVAAAAAAAVVVVQLKVVLLAVVIVMAAAAAAAAAATTAAAAGRLLAPSLQGSGKQSVERTARGSVRQTDSADDPVSAVDARVCACVREGV